MPSVPFAWLPAVVGAVLGAAVGGGARVLLARVPRGADLSVPGLVAAAAVVTGIGAGLTWGDPRFWLAVWAGWLLVVLGAIDLARHRLPDALTLPALPMTLAVVLGTAAAHPGFGSAWRALVVSAVLGLLFWGLATLAPAAMGRGDAKLVPSLGLLTGFVSVPAALLGLVLAFALGAVVSVAGIAVRRLSLRSAIPFGPFLMGGTWLVLAFPGLERLVTG